jgi:hypothetical protein
VRAGSSPPAGDFLNLVLIEQMHARHAVAQEKENDVQPKLSSFGCTALAGSATFREARGPMFLDSRTHASRARRVSHCKSRRSLSSRKAFRLRISRRFAVALHRRGLSVCPKQVCCVPLRPCR